MFEPMITVLMPVYNGSLYLREAMDSIIGQTFHDFEFLIIDDGSTDNSMDIINSYKNGRICVIKNDTNCGISAALNKGLEHARGQYIARMDCDDISMPERLYRQVLFMEEHPQIGVCGSWIQIIGEWSHGDIWRYPTEPEKIKCGLLFSNILAHPSVIIRRNVLTSTGIYYDVLYKYAQDYKLWVELAKRTLLANIPEVLLQYRFSNSQICLKKWSEIAIEPDWIKLEQLDALGIKPTPREFEIHGHFAVDTLPKDKEFAQEAEKWLIKLELANNLVGYYPKDIFSDYIDQFRTLL
ncbi:MAG: glycosyl transferase family 2 [Firmicutes bacterium]|nr:glycosyl transferase family 2 [Bacillota bacterium]